MGEAPLRWVTLVYVGFMLFKGTIRGFLGRIREKAKPASLEGSHDVVELEKQIAL